MVLPLLPPKLYLKETFIRPAYCYLTFYQIVTLTTAAYDSTTGNNMTLSLSVASVFTALQVRTSTILLLLTPEG